MYRSTVAPYTAFVEVASYSLQQTIVTSTSGGNLSIGAIEPGPAQFFDGKIGYIKIAKGATSFNHDGWKFQPPITHVINHGHYILARNIVGEGSYTSINAHFDNLIGIKPNANGQALVDSNDIFVRYKKTFAQQGENIQAKLSAGRASIADSSRIENLNLIYSE